MSAVTLLDTFARSRGPSGSRSRSRRRRAGARPASVWTETPTITRLSVAGEVGEASSPVAGIQLPVFRQRQLEERGELALDREALDVDREALDLADYEDALAQRRFARRVRRVVMLLMLPIVAAFSFATSSALIENRPIPVQIAIERVLGPYVKSTEPPPDGFGAWQKLERLRPVDQHRRGTAAAAARAQGKK